MEEHRQLLYLPTNKLHDLIESTLRGWGIRAEYVSFYDTWIKEPLLIFVEDQDRFIYELHGGQNWYREFLADYYERNKNE